MQARLGGGGSGRISDPSWGTEHEAEHAARAAANGQRYQLVHGAGDDLHRIAPWLILAGIGLVAGVIVWTASDSPEENRARHQAGGADPSSELWALIPVYGSVQQIREAESYFQRVLGVGFLMLDMATLGSAGIAARALIRAPGALIRTAVTRRGAALAVREGGIASEVAARDAATAVTQQGGRVMASGAEATAEMMNALERGSMIAVFEGGLNHAAIVARNASGQLVKLHGGPLRVLLETTRPMSERAVSSVARRVNAYAVVGVGETAVDLERATAQVQRGGPAILRWLGGNPTSCGLLQGALLEAAELPAETLARLVPGGGASARMMPITIMDHMASRGALRLVEGGTGRIVGGTLIQGGALMFGGIAPAGASTALRLIVNLAAEGSETNTTEDSGGATGSGNSSTAGSAVERTPDSDDLAFRITSAHGRDPDDAGIRRIRAELPALRPGWLVLSIAAQRSLIPFAGLRRHAARKGGSDRRGVKDG